jgi:hypothetical protein
LEVTGQFYTPTAFPPGKEPSVTIGEEAGCAPESVWTLWKRETLVPVGNLENVIFQSQIITQINLFIYLFNYIAEQFQSSRG